MMDTVDWTVQTARLIALHNQGWSYEAIGAELGCSKNAIAGKCQRLVKLGLIQPRATCIRMTAAQIAARTAKTIETNRINRLRQAAVLQTARTMPSQPRPVFTPPPPAAIIPPPPRPDSFLVEPDDRFAHLILTTRECRWPSGHPGTAAFRFCRAEVEPGRPYCAGHCRRAYASRSAAA